MYKTKAEFDQKLSSCVVFFKKSPVLIIEAVGPDSDLKLKYKDLKTGRVEETPIGVGWDFRTMGSRLGYTNVDLGPGSYQQSLYLTRVAVRNCSSTQGLSSRNVRIPMFKPSERLGYGVNKIGWGQMTESKFFYDTLERSYPSLQTVSNEMQKNEHLVSKAFDPKFAINRPDVGPFYLEYRGKNIGYSEDLEQFKVGKEFEHLYESLEHIKLKIV